MIFNTENPFTRFYFNEDNENDGFIELRVLNAAKAKEIRKKTRKTKFVVQRGGRFEEETVNEKLRDTLTWDYCIGSWDQVEDGQGGSYESTKENKFLLMENSVPFSTFVGEKLEELGEAEAELKEAVEKN